MDKKDYNHKKRLTKIKDKLYLHGWNFLIIYIHQGMHQNEMNGVILKRNLKHCLKNTRIDY